MALMKIFLALLFVGLSNAVLMWPNDDPRFPSSKNYYTRYPAPGYPTFPDSSDFMNFPFKFVFNDFPRFQSFPKVPFPSPDDIRNTNPRPGQTYTGLYASTGGSGGGVIIANVDGQVLEKRFPETTSDTSNN
uniref:Seroin3 n=1 Tax=Samia ricini TaxID=63990 RepID=A0A0M4TS00_SAMRI|nr:seroin3 [Samia ricini]